MILVTGGTGFIGRALIRHLVEMGQPVRMLVRPSPQSPNLPRGVAVEVALCSLTDERGLRAALKGVDVVYHLASAEGAGSRGDLFGVDIQGTRSVSAAAAEAGVKRLFMLSHLGADRASAYPVLKAKAIAETYVRQSGVDYTIFRSGLVFGPRDRFTTQMAALLHALPLIALMPGDGKTLIQPLWVEDLVTCLTWALDDPGSCNQVYSIGGPEYLSIQDVMAAIAHACGTRRLMIPIGPAYLRGMTVWFEHRYPKFPLSIFWLDYLAADRTCGQDAIPRLFGFIPAQFSQRLGHLQGEPWRRILFGKLRQRQLKVKHG
ncbi:MAG TPA: NAD(P)H-binding protein [Anaerolineaceae bacterium]|nr:NAD(P)H-binding protein [Anaerolineaceae bacterium]